MTPPRSDQGMEAGTRVFLQCQRCTACCRWSGQVRITDQEITAMAEYLEVSEAQFIAEYTRLRADRRGLALGEHEDGSCVFLQGGDCRVQPVKPMQCRRFPNLWSFPGFEDQCAAVSIRVDEDEYHRRIAASLGTA